MVQAVEAGAAEVVEAMAAQVVEAAAPGAVAEATMLPDRVRFSTAPTAEALDGRTAKRSEGWDDREVSRWGLAPGASLER